MDQRQRSYLAGGVLLVLIGALLLVVQTIPELGRMLGTGPMVVVGVGVGLLIVGLLINAPGMAIPAMIVGGIGGILLWQDITGQWGSWSYLWTLILGFVGVGIVLSGVISGAGISQAIRSGIGLMTISLVLFAVFGTFLGAFKEPYWPVALIVVGLVLIGTSWWRSSPQDQP